MDIQFLQDFFFWCMLINFGIYTATSIATIVFRGMLVKIQQRLFGFDEGTTLKSIQNYLATYKLLITVFNFAPWLAILIIRQS